MQNCCNQACATPGRACCKLASACNCRHVLWQHSWHLMDITQTSSAATAAPCTSGSCSTLPNTCQCTRAGPHVLPPHHCNTVAPQQQPLRCSTSAMWTLPRHPPTTTPTYVPWWHKAVRRASDSVDMCRTRQRLTAEHATVTRHCYTPLCLNKRSCPGPLATTHHTLARLLLARVTLASWSTWSTSTAPLLVPALA